MYIYIYMYVYIYIYIYIYIYQAFPRAQGFGRLFFRPRGGGEALLRLYNVLVVYRYT